MILKGMEERFECEGLICVIFVNMRYRWVAPC